MDAHKVLITTSGLGTRLGELTAYTNKCLIRIADKPVISHIIEAYPENTEFIITLGYYGTHVKQFLKLAYPNLKFTFVDVDKYQGPGSSLAYSILKCKDIIKSPFIYHASDTIIQNVIIPQFDYNWVAGSPKNDSSQYSTITLNNNLLYKINDKGELSFDYPYIGLAGIKDYELYFNLLEKLVGSNKSESLSDTHVINEMLNYTNFKYFHIPDGDWIDTGNPTELSNARKCFKSSIEVLDKKDESIFFYDDFVIKFFSNKTINKNRVDRVEKLKGLVPEIIDYTENFYKYKKAKGTLFSKSVNTKKFINFLKWSNKNLWIKKENNNFNKVCYNFYIEKTKQRISEYLNGKSDKFCNINGINIPPIFELFSCIDFDWLCNGIPSQFHGDFILDNIIEADDSFCLIDWRQDFGGDLEIGDLYYDLAKLNHNLTINHDIVNKKLFNHSEQNCHILTNSRLNECTDILHKFILENNYDLKKVKVLSSIIWLNMSPLHEYPFNNFLFNFGKYNLYKGLNT